MLALSLRRVAVAGLALFALLAVGTIAVAQDFRVFTRVDDVTNPAEPVSISHSTTLFHAGRVYDYVGQVAELVVIDFPNRNVTLLDIERRVSTTVDFDEINHVLKRSRQETLDYADQLAREPGQQRAAAELRFQLDPKFEVVFDKARSVVDLRSDHLAYTVNGAADGDRVEQVRAYLRYADWASRLNHVINPRAPYPAARMAVNDALRERDLLPVEVSLEIRGDAGAQRFRAVHRAHWQLDSTDRRRIHHWKTLLDDDSDTRRVTLLEYQRTMLTAKSR